MREIQYLAERNISRLHQPDGFRFCSGGKTECAELEEEGYQTIEWTANAADLPISDIKLLHLVPTKAQLKKAVLPAFAANLKHLENIVLDISFIRNLGENSSSLPENLRSITLTRNLRYDDILDNLIADKVEWKKDLRFPKLETLKIIGGEEKSGVIESISANNFPNLKFLAFDISAKKELDVFKRFDGISDIELLYLKDYDLFDYVGHLPIIALDLGGTNNKFDLSGIKKCKDLKFARLNSFRTEINCELFAELPELKEIDILNSKKISNIESLLTCENLASISFLDCGNPFKKGIAEKFQSRNYELLDIKYA